MTTRRYAEDTKVPVPRSREEFERLLERYGADQFVVGWDALVWQVGFRHAGRLYRLRVARPNPADPAYQFSERRTPSGFVTRQRRTAEQVASVIDQEERRIWRVLVLVVKAKLEVIDLGLESFETAFMPYALLPDGSTMAEWAEPQIQRAYETGRMPALLPGLGDEGGLRALPERGS